MKSRRGNQITVSDGSKENSTDPKESLFKQLPDGSKVVQKVADEGNVTNSLAMLTAIPEVDLGME